MAPAAIIGAVLAAGISAGVSSHQASLNRKAGNAANAAQQNALNPPAAANTNVADASKGNPTLLGRAALISTSPQGVQGTDPTGRRRLLGN